eukprot:TRINITY_DN33404_c0_g1_i1.p1 TRINITY_DN33404_c0_g1~~TRINITY_DN33404_c0_g1_i1.p1  ORF type:complete len:308 (-),score=55.48 TRINITY_DN33404_c0_g1_i1:46-969(-)
MKKKVLLMGKSGSGKTSMRSIIFANYIARDTARLGVTFDVEHSHVRLLGNLVLNLWDCGGQEMFMENYLESQRDHIFRHVEVLIYVFPIDSRDSEKDLTYYTGIIDALREYSEGAKVFCLLHKMDLIPESLRRETFLRKRKEVQELSQSLEVTCFPTSIWDDTLYKAWSEIVHSLIPEVGRLEQHIEDFACMADADEVVLYERTTFLVISHRTRRPQSDPHRFEKMSNIVKHFKLSCARARAGFSSLELRNDKFSAFIDVFTPNTIIMVVLSDPSVSPAATRVNIESARRRFEAWVQSDTSGIGHVL